MQDQIDKSTKKHKRFILKLIIYLEKHSERRWYHFFVSFLAAIDFFIVVIPVDAVLITSVFLKPKKWLTLTLIMALGSALGAVFLGICVQIFGEPLVHYFIQKDWNTSSWVGVAVMQFLIQFLEQHGLSALILISITPLPQQPAVILCALTPIPLELIFVGVFIGRAVKYFFLSWSSQHAPRLLHWLWRGIEKEKQEIAAEINKKSVVSKNV